MSTRSTILLQGNLHIYLELIDMTVHAETDNSPASITINAGQHTEADIELMTLDQWRALGLPISFSPRVEDETVTNLTGQLAEARAEIAGLRAALETLAEMRNYGGLTDTHVHIGNGVYLPAWTFARRALGAEATNP